MIKICSSSFFKHRNGAQISSIAVERLFIDQYKETSSERGSTASIMALEAKTRSSLLIGRVACETLK